MTTEQTRPLFRPEAVEAHARGRGVADDEGLELKEGRTAWSFRLLLFALALAIVVAFTVKVDQTARGRAEVRGNSAVVLVPAGVLPRLRPGQLVVLNGAEGRVTRVPTGDDAMAGEDGKAVVPVTATFAEAPAPGKATVVLSRQTLANLLMRRNG